MKLTINDITGIGPVAIEALAEHGIGTLAKLSGASVKKITAVPGFSETRATRAIANATELLGAAGTAQPAKEKKSGKKGKKDKKGKGKNKGKGKKDKKGKGKNKGKGKGKGKGKKKGKK